MHHVPKKGDRSNSSNYRPTALLSCLSKAFETILNRKIHKHLSSSNLLSDRQYGFRKGRSTGDLLAFLSKFWSSSRSTFGETFAVTLDISKAFDRVWHKSFLSKLPSYGFYPSLCIFISSLNFFSLEIRRLRGDLIEVFKMFHGFDNVHINDYFVVDREKSIRNNEFKIIGKSFRSEESNHFLFNRIVNI